MGHLFRISEITRQCSCKLSSLWVCRMLPRHRKSWQRASDPRALRPRRCAAAEQCKCSPESLVWRIRCVVTQKILSYSGNPPPPFLPPSHLGWKRENNLEGRAAVLPCRIHSTSLGGTVTRREIQNTGCTPTNWNGLNLNLWSFCPC